MKGRVLLLGLAVLACLAPAARSFDWRQERAVMDSLTRVHPRMRAAWLQERGLDDSYYTTFRKPESTGLVCIGRWPWGPSWELAGRDSLLFLGSGSGVRILSITDSVHPRMLGQVNARGLVSQVVVRDSLLFVACGSWGAQIYSVSNPASPREVGSMDAVIYDLVVRDTFCYTLGIRSGNTGADSLRIFSIANPGQPKQMGAVRDSGYSLAVTNGHAFSGGRWLMNVYDVRNPAAPQWVSSRGGPVMALFADGNKLYHLDENLVILNVSNPQSIGEFGRVNGLGGNDLYVTDGYAYLSDYYYGAGFVVVDVSDSTRPRELGRCQQEGYEYDPFVFQPGTYGYLATDWAGLTVINIHAPTQPRPESAFFSAAGSQDVHIDRELMYVANTMAGLQIVDVSQPTEPQTLGRYDTTGQSPQLVAVVARDSFAYIGWRTRLRTVDVSDPTRPGYAGSVGITNPPEDMVLRDSFVYIAEGVRFQIVNVARPREPVLVGSCVIPDYTWDMDLEGNLACVANTISLQLVDVAQPDSPRVVGSWPGDVSGVDIVDTIAYVTAPYTGYVSLSIANPAVPYVLDSVYAEKWWNDIVVDDSLAFAGGTWVQVLDVTDPRHMRLVGSWTPPYLVRRLEYCAPYLYATCYEAGVCILETAQVSISEEHGRARPEVRSGALSPNPASKSVAVRAGSGLETIVAYDALGRHVKEFKPGGAVFTMDLTGLQPGLYFVELRYNSGRRVEKLVKR